MGLENLKSAFSNIESFNQSDLTQISSQNSIITEPQEVDYMGNEKVVGFSANQNYQSPLSLFTGVGGESSNMTFTNNSLYGEGVSIGEYTNLSDTLTNIEAGTSIYSGIGVGTTGQTPITATFNDTVGSWFTSNLPTIDATTWDIPTGFTYQDKIHTTNTISDIFSGEWSYTNDIPAHGTTWNTGESPLTSYYDSIHTTNAISDTFSVPVDLLSDVAFPGGYTIEDPVGTSNFLGIHSQQLTITNYESDSNVAGITNITLNEGGLQSIYNTSDIKIQNGMVLDSSKGSNRGGSPSNQFNLLYNGDQTVNTENKYFGMVQEGSLYETSMEENFNLKSNMHNSGERSANGPSLITSLTSLGLGSINVGGYGNANEPYIVSINGEEDDPSIFFPKTRLQKDVVRVSKFLNSHKGSQFVLNQEIMGSFQQYRPYYDPGSTILNLSLPSEGLGTPMFNLPRDFGVAGAIIDLVNTANTYTEWLDTRVSAFDTLNLTDAASTDKTFAEREALRKPLAFQVGDLLQGAATSLVNSLIPGAGGAALDVAGIDKTSNIDSKNNVNTSIDSTKVPMGGFGKGDLMTIMPISDTDENLETVEELPGMPLYFKDLRDGSHIYFRAYISGLSDTISPNWNSENYIGRSEPVYTYTSAERELSFNLTLFANTKDELNMIYTKMNRLTSLCYPEYKSQVVLTEGEIDSEATNALGTSRVMMKPPLTKFRLGELFGSKSAEMVGFLKSLSFNFPDESPWEIKNGHRVPKHITADIGFQVIHSEVPSLDFARITDLQNKPTSGNSFYGINQTLGVEMENV